MKNLNSDKCTRKNILTEHVLLRMIEISKSINVHKQCIHKLELYIVSISKFVEYLFIGLPTADVILPYIRWSNTNL